MDKQKKIVISHPNGNANVRGAANGFFNAAILESFHTSIACYKGGWLYRLAKGPLKEFRRREYSAYLKPYTKTSPCIIRKSKFPQNPKRSVRFSGKGTKRSVQKRKARNTQKAETKVL